MTRILVVDDEEIMCEMIGEMLQQQGYEVSEASNGREALKKFKKGFFDLVITDIVMPKMDGIKTIKKLVKINKDIKIIAISGGDRNGSEYGDLGFAKHIGANQVLAKPFDMEELLKMVDDLTGIKRTE